jgi:hypothetical protein
MCYRVSVLLSFCGEKGPPKKDSRVLIDAVPSTYYIRKLYASQYIDDESSWTTYRLHGYNEAKPDVVFTIPWSKLDHNKLFLQVAKAMEVRLHAACRAHGS